jgi:hypothetical protein
MRRRRFDAGPKVVGAPVGPVERRVHARDLGGDVGRGGGGFELLGPRRHRGGADGRLAEVVDDDREARKRTGELRRGAEVARVDGRKLEDEAALLEE